MAGSMQGGILRVVGYVVTGIMAVTLVYALYIALANYAAIAV
jgi:hypothetical protein